MSLICQFPLAAITFPAKDIEASKRFYKDVIGIEQIEVDEENTKSKSLHFDFGNIRLTLTPVSLAKSEKLSAQPTSQLVFVIENSIEKVYEDLAKRGVKFKSKKISEDASGKSATFADPDGNVIILWQPPRRDTKNFKGVEGIVRHYELVSRALADLRLDEE
ncbi:MAG: VOC family protein [Nitrososphaerota archaeon]|jgi:predicted enzyme related to lactoylglutathione lyase|nr:VOC family protein [Nitrososphaerota archaeon]MDG6924055.1 VOC family protein [Nitrososphaerota archaeon]